MSASLTRHLYSQELDGFWWLRDKNRVVQTRNSQFKKVKGKN